MSLKLILGDGIVSLSLPLLLQLLAYEFPI